MFEKIFLGFFILLTALSFAYAEDMKSEDYLCILDEGSHTQREFNTILKKIQSSHPKYTRGEIVSFIALAYGSLKANKPNISVYDVAKGTMVISDDNLGIDLESFVIAYLRSRNR